MPKLPQVAKKPLKLPRSIDPALAVASFLAHTAVDKEYNITNRIFARVVRDWLEEVPIIKDAFIHWYESK